MKTVQWICAAALMIGAGELLAQECANNNRLSAAQIQSALGAKWFCAQKVAGDPNSMWREFIPNAASGTFQECHSGLTTGPDPIDPKKGTFTIAGQGAVGTINFNYGGGNSYTYWVCPDIAGSRWVFRDTSGGGGNTTGFYVHLSSCPSTGISTAQKTNCPP
jgi:hypothetical protein